MSEPQEWHPADEFELHVESGWFDSDLAWIELPIRRSYGERELSGVLNLNTEDAMELAMQILLYLGAERRTHVERSALPIRPADWLASLGQRTEG